MTEPERPSCYDANDALLKGSEARLWALIEERATHGADRKAIDQKIWDLFGEDWAIVYTDLAGFSRKTTEFGITHFLQVIFEKKRLLLPIVERHNGILVKVEADSFLLLFRRASSALRCAIQMQQASKAYNLERLPEEQVLLCVGIGHGTILKLGDSDAYGQEVNAASKLGEDSAKVGEILMTEAARTAAGEIPGVTYEEFGPVSASERNYRVVFPL